MDRRKAWIGAGTFVAMMAAVYFGGEFIRYLCDGPSLWTAVWSIGLGLSWGTWFGIYTRN